MPELGAAPAQPLHEHIGDRIQPLVKARDRDQLERGETGRHGDRIAR